MKNEHPAQLAQSAAPAAHHRPCFAHWHLTDAENGFYQVCLALAYSASNSKPGVIDFSSPRFAQMFAGSADHHRMSKSAADRRSKSLWHKGWFVRIKASVHDPETGQQTATEYRVLKHAEWAQKHPHACQQVDEDLLTFSVTVGGADRDGGEGGAKNGFGQRQPSLESTDELESVPVKGNGQRSPFPFKGTAERLNTEKTAPSQLPVESTFESESVPASGTTKEQTISHSSSLSCLAATIAMKTIPVKGNGLSEENLTELLRRFDSKKYRDQLEWLRTECGGDEMRAILAARPDFVYTDFDERSEL